MGGDFGPVAEAAPGRGDAPAAYYNEFDRGAAAWLRELMSGGYIAEGRVDDRSIHEVQAGDLPGRAHFFAGVGGWDLALQLAGWPADLPVWTGSCPCQPFSAAGKRKGVEDPRHLWPEFRRLIAERRPPVVFGEQVASADGRIWLAGVRSDLEALGYAVGAADLCSAGVGAPNIRQRLYWVAYAWGDRLYQQRGDSGSPLAAGEPGRHEPFDSRIDGGMACAQGERLERRGDGQGRIGAGPVEILPAGSGDEFGRMGRSESIGNRPASVPGVDLEIPRGGRFGVLGGSSPFGLGYWDAFDILPCLDGKARRIEPGSFPLAHGIPGRVGLLRGYGNAINPFVAAEFIAATYEELTARSAPPSSAGSNPPVTSELTQPGERE